MSKRLKQVSLFCQFNLEGILIATYFGVREASRCTGINGSHIGDCCNHKPNRKKKNCWRVQMGVAIKARDAGSAHPQARELAHPLHMEFLRRNYLVDLYDEVNPD